MSKKQRKYSSEFKIRVIMDMREHRLGYRETVRKYFGAKTQPEEDLYKPGVQRGERMFLEKGAAIFSHHL